MGNQFRLDRSAFTATSAVAANDHVTYWKDKTYKERLEAAFYLICKAYGIDETTKLDRTVFSMRKRYE